jgi:para-nitrobenzyl esterase
LPNAEPQVRTAAGDVRGRWEDGVAVFRGIPFAEPPVGRLRFAAPRPPRPWAGTRDAAAFGPPPPQSARTAVSAPADTGGTGEWLTVNVWSPGPGAARLPVMVWVYGGAYVAGFSGDPTYDGARFAHRGVVLVTFNYRVGMEGFAQLDGAPANRGLLDQIAALRWVQDNIAAFGGDPGNVTIFGESAGAGCIAALLAMDASAGLFRRAIAQSVPGTFFSAGLAADLATAAARAVGAKATAAGLAGLDPGRLAAAAQAVTESFGHRTARWGAVAHTLTAFSPVVDGEVLTAAPWQALAAGRARGTDLIIGHNRDECRLFTLGADLPAGPMEAAVRAFSPQPDGRPPDGRTPDGTAYRAAYPGAGLARQYELAYSDWLFRMPSLHLADAHAGAGGRAYLYELTYPAPGAALGACHALDVPLVFGTFGAGFGPMLFGDPVPAAAMALGEQMRDAWTAFAAGQSPGWPAYTPAERLTRIFDEQQAVVSYPEETSRRLWAGHRFGVLTLAS